MMTINPFEIMASVAPLVMTLPYVYWYHFVNGMMVDLVGGFGGSDEIDSESKND
jgi:hypothetical protein